MARELQKANSHVVQALQTQIAALEATVEREAERAERQLLTAAEAQRAEQAQTQQTITDLQQEINLERAKHKREISDMWRASTTATSSSGSRASLRIAAQSQPPLVRCMY